jgi:hypothetical protein
MPVNSSVNETNLKLEHLRELFTDDLLAILPADKNISLAYNYHDYPRVVQEDAEFEPKKNYTIRKMELNSAFRRNKCLKDYYKPYQMNTAYFISNRQFKFMNLVPIFSSCKTACHKDILMPGFHHIRETNKSLEDSTEWKDKETKFLWRGATTGIGWRPMTNKDKIDDFQRMRLVKWAMEINMRKNDSNLVFPVDIDVGFSGTHGCNQSDCDRIKNE